MKKYITIFLLMVSFYAYAQESSADLGVTAIGIVVSDIEKSEAFYTDLLGMVPAGSFSLDEQWSKEAGAANDRPFKVKMFKMVDRNTATIFKLAYFDKVKPRPKQTGVDSNAGVNYLTLNYSDLEPVRKRLEAAGITPLGWVKRDTYQLFFVRDPDGIFIELVGPAD
ncbi:VOC family protein [Fulvivirga sedimenti]|uniref:VOC family protein n=1 Tax=Fulvivirga sedimenti TaxID=2879465 RepID=A0A9X1HUY6_9BACT|nr:VOC family protein [Fulvivirga sedimenti]MCA6078748.1 VOC family protein [Fulvivirga sedimenti]